jgi:hypothetical protein
MCEKTPDPLISSNALLASGVLVAYLKGLKTNSAERTKTTPKFGLYSFSSMKYMFPFARAQWGNEIADQAVPT